MLDEILRKEMEHPDLLDVSMSEVTKDELRVKKILYPVSDPLNREQLNVMKEIARSIFELRVSKLLEGESPRGFDKELLEAIRKMEEVYVSFVSSEYVTKNGKVLCSVKQEMIFHGKRLVPGDLVFLGFNDAVLLSITNYITPCSLFNNGSNEGS
ncbi:hypothetical protein [Sulfuracidifex tepidarius]|uniref:Uncharacterized protein n=1 Tax=Sulfuracidifex tepidarius TaxID=1294262 RepID=A0A510E1I0_9CREN|nr:hypothetical protein [Sulfuracidifex tepidarius]BBG23570.1 hypothetical protein IC006_0857 [Sulfuracidifex tepidarius]BBG26317.1 hypothetical protein IC007_0824 [Sulfuracidifex tepidarius]